MKYINSQRRFLFLQKKNLNFYCYDKLKTHKQLIIYEKNIIILNDNDWICY